MHEDVDVVFRLLSKCALMLKSFKNVERCRNVPFPVFLQMSFTITYRLRLDSHSQSHLRLIPVWMWMFDPIAHLK